MRQTAMTGVILIIFLFISQSNGQNVTTPELGTLIGSLGKTAWTSETIYQFMGIRYALSPSGPRRFKPPVSAVPWLGEHNVQKPGRPCPVLKYIANMTLEEKLSDLEDCLHLSIYSKNLSAKYPVMFYIHGGAFDEGAAYQHPPNYLLSKNIVLVVTQYRLGPLGFFSTNTEAIPGNVAILDVLMALHWTRSFIHYFGGDSNQITVFGQSAGAALVSTLILSPAVPPNLFQRAILQSGSVLSKWAVGSELTESATKLASLAGCNVESISMVNRCLQDLEIIPMLQAYVKLGQIGGSQIKFGGAYNYILPKSAMELYDSYNSSKKKIALMAGATKHEGTFALAMEYDILDKLIDIKTNNKFMSYDLVDNINRRFSAYDLSGTLEGYMHKILFTQDELNRGNFTEMVPGLIDLIGAAVIKGPTLKMVKTHARYFPNQTWLYSFDYAGEFTRFGYFEDTSHYPFQGGVHHSNDNIYLFPWPEFVTKLNPEDRKIAKLMVELWTSFATNGIPSAGAVSKWPTVTRYSGPYLHINKKCKIGEDYLDEFTVASREARSGQARNKLEISLIFLTIIYIFFKLF